MKLRPGQAGRAIPGGNRHINRLAVARVIDWNKCRATKCLQDMAACQGAIANPYTRSIRTSPIPVGPVVRQSAHRKTGSRGETIIVTYSEKFSGTRVLIVEDEFLLAEETRRKLEALGSTVIGPTPDVDKALEYLDTTQVDAAILDIYVAGEFVFPVAERLQDMGIPFVFASAYDAKVIPPRFEGFVLCEKPFELEKIAQALFGRARRDH